jgi:8-oxo-dGTP diphosphatase
MDQDLSWWAEVVFAGWRDRPGPRYARLAAALLDAVDSRTLARGRVLLLRHRLWPAGGQWGFPSGFARRGERLEDTIVREAREETGLTVRVGRLVELRSGYRFKVEVYYEARLAGGLDGLVLDEQEILEARLFPLDALPAGMPDLHRELARRKP